jgi:hypothetical protein
MWRAVVDVGQLGGIGFEVVEFRLLARVGWGCRVLDVVIPVRSQRIVLGYGLYITELLR